MVAKVHGKTNILVPEREWYTDFLKQYKNYGKAQI